MTTNASRVPAAKPLPALASMQAICEERILLCGPCDTKMSPSEYEQRHRRLNDLASTWTQGQRTDFWYTLDALCAGGNPSIRATPGLVITPENLAYEETRINRIAHDLMDDSELQGFRVWGFYLYTDPVIYSFTPLEIARHSLGRLAAIEGKSRKEAHELGQRLADAAADFDTSESAMVPGQSVYEMLWPATT